MSMNHSSREGQEGAADGKRSYEPPSFRYEEVFVTSALNCVKAIDQSTCMFHPPTKSS
jgi:hypothetical protein